MKIVAFCYEWGNESYVHVDLCTACVQLVWDWDKQSWSTEILLKAAKQQKSQAVFSFNACLLWYTSNIFHTKCFLCASSMEK